MPSARADGALDLVSGQRVRRIAGKDSNVRGDCGPQLAEDPFKDGLITEVHAAIGAGYADAKSSAVHKCLTGV